MSDQSRDLKPSETPFSAAGSAPLQTIGRIEGQVGYSGATFRSTIVGKDMVFLEIYRPKGLVDPEHAHMDHESVCYLVSGRMRCIIDGREFIAEPGATWIHHPGVQHWHETLEDSVQIEIKSPPKRSWG